jgi:hypothetical protein
MPADNFVVYVPKSMNFSNPSGAEFQAVQDDPRVTTNITKNVHPGQALAFTVSGEGQMPRDTQQRPGTSPQAAMGMGSAASDTSAPASAPGGGIGNPIGTPDPLTRYKWWILGGLTLLLVLAAIYLLRNRGASSAGSLVPVPSSADFESRSIPSPPRSIAPVSEYTPPPIPPRAPAPAAPYPAYAPATSPGATAGKTALLGILKEELFAIESEKLSGTLSVEEYAEIKTGLEALLRRALRKQ